jgi:hypothetical protein
MNLFRSKPFRKLVDEEGSTVLFDTDANGIELDEDPGESTHRLVISDDDSDREVENTNQGNVGGRNGAAAIGGNPAAWASISNLSSDRPNRNSRRQRHTAQDIRNPLKRTLYKLLEDPSSSSAAFWTNVFVSMLIVFSAVTTTIETIPTFRSAESSKAW